MCFIVRLTHQLQLIPIHLWSQPIPTPGGAYSFSLYSGYISHSTIRIRSSISLTSLFCDIVTFVSYYNLTAPWYTLSRIDGFIAWMIFFTQKQVNSGNKTLPKLNRRIHGQRRDQFIHRSGTARYSVGKYKAAAYWPPLPIWGRSSSSRWADNAVNLRTHKALKMT